VLVPRAEVAGPEGDVVYVYGRVPTPGTFPIDAARTVLQAVIAAGGPLEDADVGSIRVVRPGAVRARVIEVDLDDYTHDGVLFANVQLQPGDTVTVPKSQRAVAWRVTQQAFQAMGNALGTVFFFFRLGDEDQTGTTVIVGEQTPAAP
jgi:protein involved in polysaccharide export with SLBB domain